MSFAVTEKSLRNICPSAEDLILQESFASTCTVCNKRFRCSPNLRVHMEKIHKMVDNGAGKLSHGPNELCRYFCPELSCKFHEVKAALFFANLKALRQHYQKTHMPKCWFCERCKVFKCSLERVLRYHLKSCKGTSGLVVQTRTDHTYDSTPATWLDKPPNSRSMQLITDSPKKSVQANNPNNSAQIIFVLGIQRVRTNFTCEIGVQTVNPKFAMPKSTKSVTTVTAQRRRKKLKVVSASCQTDEVTQLHHRPGEFNNYSIFGPTSFSNAQLLDVGHASVQTIPPDYAAVGCSPLPEQSQTDFLCQTYLPPFEVVDAAMMTIPNERSGSDGASIGNDLFADEDFGIDIHTQTEGWNLTDINIDDVYNSLSHIETQTNNIDFTHFFATVETQTHSGGYP